MMRVRLKRNISGSAARTPACLFEREGFGVLKSLVEIEAFAYDLTVAVRNHTADQRAGAHLSYAAQRQLKGAAHHSLIEKFTGFQVSILK